LIDSSHFLGHDCIPSTKVSRRGFGFLRPACLQPLKLDFQDPVVEVRLDFVGVDPERQLDGTREAAVSALVSLPIAALLLLGTPCPVQSQHVLLQVDRDVARGHTRQLAGHQHAVLAEPDIDRRKVAGRWVNPENSRFISLCIRRSSTKGSKPNRGNFKGAMALNFLAY
jgi:hypothetical protein